MQLIKLHKHFDDLQLKFGAKGFNAVYGTGETKSPRVCFVFMNPTGKNISALENWNGIRAPWLGTKNVWKLLTTTEMLSEKLNNEIQSKKSQDWNVEFAKRVYKEIKHNKCFITNLAKYTQKDAAHLPDFVFKEYRGLMFEEIKLLNPKVIIAFGNQVGSILLDKNINVSKYRRRSENLVVNNKTYKVFPVFYPVGQGMRNMGKSIEDIRYILK